jgi:transposase-like protein
MSNRQPPLYCPFCADEDLYPSDQEQSAWECRSCARVFAVRMLGLSLPDRVIS